MRIKFELTPPSAFTRPQYSWACMRLELASWYRKRILASGLHTSVEGHPAEKEPGFAVWGCISMLVC